MHGLHAMDFESTLNLRLALSSLSLSLSLYALVYANNMPNSFEIKLIHDLLSIYYSWKWVMTDDTNLLMILNT